MVSKEIRHVAAHLLIPLLMCLGMGLSYLGAFHQPEPNHIAVAVVGDSPQAKVLAQTLKDTGGDALDVVTVANRDEAVTQLRDRDLVGAFVPDAQHPEALVAVAGSDTSAIAVESIFRRVSDKQGVPLTVTDVTSPSSGDPTSQGIFFLLVAVSIGSYGGVAAIGAAGAGLRMRVRAALCLITSLLVSIIGMVIAGPVFHVIDSDLLAVGALAWIYSAGVLAIGIGLHTYFKQLTTLITMVLFVMLNFTSSGGVYSPELQNGFWGALHAFWNGAGFVEGTRSLLYFDNAGFGSHLTVLFGWLAVGVLLMVAAARTEKRHASTAPRDPEAAALAAEEETAEAVGV
ncbi:hypothetical protein GFY24_34765 [Nocardia sp. SYP-A9097]|uniref:hypothetical protein n=1 Tax=Nocardia sp. SYP-A9097 TaxID=2663237 RepID=UPI00129B024A|nr:hypothetical protein [Nocardia sp. SYP-A9097]MRH92526.1 hypothetical protein [Nocardia sp. SYP-A9097]